MSKDNHSDYQSYRIKVRAATDDGASVEQATRIARIQSDLDRAHMAAMSGRVRMNGPVLKHAYGSLMQEYTRIRDLRTTLQSTASSFQPDAVGPRIDGVDAAAAALKERMEKAVLAQVILAETELVDVLTAMHKASSAMATTDGHGAAAIGAAGGHR